MSYLIEQPETKERQHVASLDGYDGWAVISEGAGSRPRATLSARERRRAEVRAMDSAERFDVIMDEINALKARLDKAGL